MIANPNAKTTRRRGVVVLTATAIAAVTLALVTAVTVSMMPVQKAAASNCISSPNSKSVACSGSGGSDSCSSAVASLGCANPQGNIPGSSASLSADSKGFHFSCSFGKGSKSENTGHPTANSGKGC